MIRDRHQRILADVATLVSSKLLVDSYSGTVTVAVLALTASSMDVKEGDHATACAGISVPT
jgi:hypothetical protein